jgi:hypothetical protein
MAIVTPPKRTLVEAQQVVRHPLERVRGTIRTYVALEGTALLLILLALWFWVTFVLDFAPFRLFGWDWVQVEEISRPVRALSLGCLFLCAVALMRAGLIGRVFGPEARLISRTAFASTDKRQTLPVWLRLPLVGTAVAFGCWIGSLVGSAVVPDGSPVEWLGTVIFLAAGPLVGFLVTGAHELFGVSSTVSRWVRAPAAGAGCAIGALLGTLAGNYVSGTIGAVVGSGLGAIVGDVIALVNVGVITTLIRGQSYLVPLAVPSVGVYLMLWVLAGLAAAVSGWLAAAIVLLLMVGPVVAVTLARLLRDFRDDAIALVLERRFPAVLGDRLITAVELANPRTAAELGYSEIMVVQTIHDAAERVQTVPVRDVFDWKRLYRYWALVLGVTLGLYLVAGALFSIPAVGQTAQGERAGFAAFHQAAGLALERNLLLQNIIWPRRAFLQVLDWPGGTEKRIGKDDSAPAVKVRAYKWVVADAKTREGWRGLTWHDLEKNHSLLGSALPAVNFRETDEHGKTDWGQPRDPDIGWTLDEIELHLDRDEAHATLEPQTKDALRDVLSRLQERAADPAMRRTMRMLIVPTQVTIRYREIKGGGGGELTLQKQGDNEYTGQFPDLKESVNFTARGEDYQTPSYRITVVPPPSLVELVYDEERLAYMWYRVRGDDPNALRGLRQLMPARPVSVTGGDTSRIDPVPAGSNLVLTAKTDKELKEVVIDEPRKGVAAVRGDVKLIDKRTFQVRFDDVRPTPERPAYDFYFRFVDSDGVKGERHIVIRPKDDMVPDVSIDLKVIRKTAQGYMVTPNAYIPLEAKVIDDHGLSRLEYACTVTKLDRQAEQSGRGLLALTALHLLTGGPGQELVAAHRIAALSREAKGGPRGTSETGPQRFPVPTFRVGPDEFVPLDRIQAQLGKAEQPKIALTNTFLLEKLEEKDPRNKDTDLPYFFSLDQVKNPEGKPLMVDVRDEVQPRYRMQLWMEAIDTDIETGKEALKTDRGVDYRGNRGVSRERLTFIVVAENELLSEIAKEEDNLFIKLGEQVNRLKDGLSKLDTMRGDLNAQKLRPEQFLGMQARAEELSQTLERAELAAGEVYGDYQRILRELIVNRVEATTKHVQKDIVEPLNVALNGNDEDKSATDNFPKARAGIADLKTALAEEGAVEAKVASAGTKVDEARVRLNGLIKRLSDVLEKMESLQGINDVIKKLQLIEAEQNHQKEILAAILKQLQDEFFGGFNEDKPKEDKPKEDKP